MLPFEAALQTRPAHTWGLTAFFWVFSSSFLLTVRKQEISVCDGLSTRPKSAVALFGTGLNRAEEK